MSQPDDSGHARESCPAMTSAELISGAPHRCLRAIKYRLPSGATVAVYDPELAELADRAPWPDPGPP